MHLLCASKRCRWVQGAEPLVRVSIRGGEAETLLAYGHAMEAANLTAF